MSEKKLSRRDFLKGALAGSAAVALGSVTGVAAFDTIQKAAKKLADAYPLLCVRVYKIKNRFFTSFLYYVPYVTLAVMTFPSIVQTTMSPLSGAVALAVGIVAAWRRMGLFPVAAICCAIVYLMDSVIM